MHFQFNLVLAATFLIYYFSYGAYLYFTQTIHHKNLLILGWNTLCLTCSNWRITSKHLLTNIRGILFKISNLIVLPLGLISDILLSRKKCILCKINCFLFLAICTICKNKCIEIPALKYYNIHRGIRNSACFVVKLKW